MIQNNLILNFLINITHNGLKSIILYDTKSNAIVLLLYYIKTLFLVVRGEARYGGVYYFTSQEIVYLVGIKSPSSHLYMWVII
jgi:hypothetical protein